MTEPGRDRVECYSGHTYAQEPRVVVWQGRRFPVAGIERRWRTPEGPAFYVGTEQGILFELHYDELADAWAIRPLFEPEPEAPMLIERDEGKHEGENQNPHHDGQEDKEVRERR